MLLYVASDIGGVNGAPQAARDILISLLLTGYPVTVISNGKCPLPQRVDGKLLPSPNWIIPVENVSFSFKGDRYLPVNLAKWLTTKLQRFLQKKRLQQLNTKLVFVNGLNSHLLWRRINPGMVTQTVTIVHMSPRHCQYNANLSLDRVLAAMKEYSHFVFVSSTCQKEWLTLENFKNKNSYYIPNCCKEDIVNNLMTQDRIHVRQRLNIPCDRFIVVCVASLQHRKGQDLLVEQFSQLLNIVPHLQLYLVGPIADAKWAKELLQQIDNNGFGDKIKYIGARNDAMDFIYAADLFVLPSRAEAMPLSILEAMALKTPVIASDVDGVPELIEHEINGLLFSNGQSQSFVNAFEQMATNQELRQTFADRAHEKYWSNFSRTNQITKYDKIIKEIIDI